MNLIETIKSLRDHHFLIPLKVDAVMSWCLARTIVDLSLVPEVQYSFGAAKGIDIDAHPVFFQLAQQFCLKTRIFVIRMPADFQALPIHIDGHADKNNAASIIWPLEGCDERSPTKWFETKRHEFELIKNSYFLKNAEDLKVCHSQPMLSARKAPYLFRSDILHCGYNFSGTTKVIVKWELNVSDWEDAKHLFASLDLIAT